MTKRPQYLYHYRCARGCTITHGTALTACPYCLKHTGKKYPLTRIYRGAFRLKALMDKYAKRVGVAKREI